MILSLASRIFVQISDTLELITTHLRLPASRPQACFCLVTNLSWPSRDDLTNSPTTISYAQEINGKSVDINHSFGGERVLSCID